MAEHHAEVVVEAPVEQVFAMWSHFNDYPKFMSSVREVTYLDGERSHWVVDVAGTHAWDAVNEGWVPNRRIGWRAISGIDNHGSVEFEPLDPERTRLRVTIAYTPPAGALGALAETLAVGGAFDRRVQHDLEHFAEMVRQAPPGALDPTSSTYLFHAESAAARGAATASQQQTMYAGDLADNEGLAQATVPSVPGTTTSHEVHEDT